MKVLSIKFKLFFFIFFIFFNKSSACAVCAGDFTDNEIIAYTLSVVLLIVIMFTFFYWMYIKIVKNYDLD